jgi:hypothetical protein
MKIQNSILVVLFLLFAYAGSTVQAQSSQEKVRAALASMPSESTIKKLDPDMQKVVRESIAILEAAQKIKDPTSAEAKALYERSERNANTLNAMTKAECKKKCWDDYQVKLAACAGDFMCRVACLANYKTCIIQCHYSTVRPELDLNENVQNETGGGRQ